MCQQLYSYLKRDESATNRLLVNPIEVNNSMSSARNLFSKVIEKLN